MKKWMKENWDKLVAIALSWVIAGIIGFFSAIYTTKSEIQIVNAGIGRIETELERSIRPQIAKIDNYGIGIEKLTNDVDYLKRQVEISTQINKLLDLKLEQQRERTLKELQQLLSEADGKHN